jgi:hypothetical protein
VNQFKSFFTLGGVRNVGYNEWHAKKALGCELAYENGLES